MDSQSGNGFILYFFLHLPFSSFLLQFPSSFLDVSGRSYSLGAPSALMCHNHVQPFAIPWTIQPARLLCPWGFPGINTGVGCHFLLQGIIPIQRLNLHLLSLLHRQADSLSVLITILILAVSSLSGIEGSSPGYIKILIPHPTQGFSSPHPSACS